MGFLIGLIFGWLIFSAPVKEPTCLEWIDHPAQTEIAAVPTETFKLPDGRTVLILMATTSTAWSECVHYEDN